ncbi:uncharacterized protein LOC127091089 isoform X2 [Lathyrus oleraceus]|uniref:uncharacterized protein LOC127091089 isoform X2 n=1 Tax=Pisum sativum TaxID=3888 RepID=UPI0021CF7CF2|nr:uncharacterized protein LOC127091089 isoform X2 [Pisum sativum]
MEDESATNSHDSICPICLGPLTQESYLDHCLHRFCFNCILRWTNIVSSKHQTPPSSVKCPLYNFSIIYGLDGTSFQRHYINTNLQDCFVLSKAHRYRLQCYYTQQGFLEDIFNVSLYWKSRKYNQPNNWLQTWLTREIQALTQEEDVDIIVHHISGVVKPLWTSKEQKLHTKEPEKKQEEFMMSVSEAARPFLGARTDRFVYEIQLFLASGLNIEAYDAVYIQRLGWSSPGENTEVSQNELIDRTTVIPYLYIFDDDSDGNE